MRFRILFRIAIFTLVVLLCAGFAVSWYLKISSAEKMKDFDLYTLVPANTLCVLDTDNTAELMQGINELQCSKEGHFLYASRLFGQIKEHINMLLAEAPHGLSQQMSKMLISFHEPDDLWNQVYYCRLGVGDNEFIGKFLDKYSSSGFPAKSFEYKGETIKIFPMPDDTFLSCYFNSHFLVISYQKRLIEEVIDALKEKKSILKDETFAKIRADRKVAALPAVVYIKVDSIFETWTEFSMKMNDHAIYFSGINYQVDSCFTPLKALYSQPPVEEFPGDILPASTFFFSRRSAADLRNVFEFTTDETSLTTCFFHSDDSLASFCAVATIPVKDVITARRSLKNMLAVAPNYLDSVFVRLTGLSQNITPCTSFQQGQLVLAADSLSLSSYVEAIESGRVLGEEESIYKEGVTSLSESYNFMSMADMEYMFGQADGLINFVPSYFRRHKEFFRHFVLSTQFTVSDGIAYPNVVFLYKK